MDTNRHDDINNRDEQGVYLDDTQKAYNDLNTTQNQNFTNTNRSSAPFGVMLNQSQYGDPNVKAKLMAEAKMEKEQKRLQMLQMEARIKKLQIEEEKAKKRINEARKQQQFISQMKEDKIRKQQEKQRFIQEMQLREEENRKKIMEDRQRQKDMLMRSQNSKYETNKKISEEIKEQKHRIKNSIEQGKMTYLEEKAKANVDYREHINTNKQFKATQNGAFIQQSQNAYIEKIDKAKQEAIEYERKMKELEQQEQLLISKLQKTQLQQNSEFEKLRALKAKSVKDAAYSMNGDQQYHSINNHENSQLNTTNNNNITYHDQQQAEEEKNQHSDQKYETREKDLKNVKPLKQLHKPLVLVGPSGAGKSTLTKYLMEKFKGVFEFSVSSTTRGPRAGEENGVHYYFMERPDFEIEIKAGDFIEYNEVHGNYYGTSKSEVLETQKQGKICLLDIDVKGARDIHKLAVIDCNYVLITVPSIEELRNRLQARGTETEETLAKRVGNAEKELKTAEEIGIFQKTLVNDTEEQFIKDSVDYISKLYGIKPQ
eukprot:403370616